MAFADGVVIVGVGVVLLVMVEAEKRIAMLLGYSAARLFRRAKVAATL